MTELREGVQAGGDGGGDGDSFDAPGGYGLGAWELTPVIMPGLSSKTPGTSRLSAQRLKLEPLGTDGEL